MATNRDKNKRVISDKKRDGKTSKTVAKKSTSVAGSMLSAASRRGKYSHGKYSDKSVATTMKRDKPAPRKTVSKQAHAPKMETMSDETFDKLMEYRLKAHESTWKELAKR